MFKITWIHIVVFSSIILLVFSLYARFLNKSGTFTDMKDLFVSEDMLIENLYTGRDIKNESKGENIARTCLQNIFNVPFPNVRIDELRNNDTNRNLELDCYNEDLKIAVEYQGIQHYKFVPFFHKTHDKFLEQRKRDVQKKELCKLYGITLITIPHNLKHDMICFYIKQELKRLNKFNLNK